jgi:hypothetical protein
MTFTTSLQFANLHFLYNPAIYCYIGRQRARLALPPAQGTSARPIAQREASLHAEMLMKPSMLLRT